MFPCAKDSTEDNKCKNRDNPSLDRVKSNSGTTSSLLQLFVEEPWEKNQIIYLGARLSSQKSLADVRDSYMLWGNERSVDYYSCVTSMNVRYLFERRITSELRNVLPLLLKCNGDVNYADDYGQTILHAYLADNESHNDRGFSRVSFEGSKVVKVVNSLLERGASVNAVDNDGKTPLHIAAENKKLQLIEPMLNYFRYTDSIDVCDAEGYTVLHKVVYYRNFSGDKVLLGAVRGLLSRGADPSKRNNNGMTPLQYAVSHCNVNLLRIFQQHGADFSVDGDNLLNLIYTGGIYGDESRRMETIDFLVEQGCDVNAKDKDGFSILHFLAKRDLSVKTIERLIELGADVNCQANKYRQTPLHSMLHWTNLTIGSGIAVKFNGVIPALLNAGADWEAVDHEGRKPLHHVLIADNSVVLSCILKFGANINDEIAKKLMRNCSNDSRQAILLRAVELKTIGYAIDKDYELLIAGGLRDHEKRCANEVNAMKSVGASIYQFMHMNWRRQAALVDCVPRDLQSKFPIYHELIQTVCRHAVRRSQLVEPAKVAWYQVTGANLPDICVERVLHFLNNWSLKVLIDASEDSCDV